MNPRLDSFSETVGASFKLTRDDFRALDRLYGNRSEGIRELIRREAARRGIMKRTKSRKTGVVTYKLTA